MVSFIILISFHNSCADIRLLTYVVTVVRNASTREFKRFFVLPSYLPALHNTRVYRDILVGIVTRLRDRHPRNRSSLPGSVIRFIFSHKARGQILKPTQSVPFIGYPGDKVAVMCNWRYYHHLEKLRMSGSISPQPHTSVWRVQVNLNLINTCEFGFEFCWDHGCSSLVFVVWIVASARIWSRVQRSSTACVCVCVFVCPIVSDLKTSKMRRPMPELCCCTKKKNVMRILHFWN
jgi:hypothetical protein